LQLGKTGRTSNPRIYVVGDATGGPQTAHGAVAEADRTVRAAFLLRPGDAAQLPRVVYLDPEIAELGMSEAEARRRHSDSFQVLRAAFADSDIARARRQTYGLVKLMASASGRLIGVGIVGQGAAELAALFSLAMAQRLSVRDLATLPVPLPSFAGLARRLGEQASLAGPSPWMRRWLSIARLLP
jgi:pyruvate/2-oxoglutarate dehydrogenase complex dihydrolipoamide dehydrogenase (E3) component